jgi:hypothetical protein
MSISLTALALRRASFIYLPPVAIVGPEAV